MTDFYNTVTLTDSELKLLMETIYGDLYHRDDDDPKVEKLLQLYSKFDDYVNGE